MTHAIITLRWKQHKEEPSTLVCTNRLVNGLIVCAKAIRRMSAALQSGDSSGGVK